MTTPTRVRDIEQGETREFSRLIDDPLLDPPLRLWIEASRNDLTRVGIVAVTSRNETAEEKRGGQRIFWCTRDDLRWFIEQLPLALAFLEEPNVTTTETK